MGVRLNAPKGAQNNDMGMNQQHKVQKVTIMLNLKE
jgi:hypothetical protein